MKRAGGLISARTHLGHVFDKTGTSLRAELVRVLPLSQLAIREEYHLGLIGFRSRSRIAVERWARF